MDWETKVSYISAVPNSTKYKIGHLDWLEKIAEKQLYGVEQWTIYHKQSFYITQQWQHVMNVP